MEINSVLPYALTGFALSLTVVRLLMRSAADDLVRLEVTGWKLSCVLTGTLVVGFATVAAFPATWRTPAEQFADPVLVIMTSTTPSCG